MGRQQQHTKQQVAKYAGAAVLASACAVFSWRYARAISAPKLFFKPGPLSKLVVERCALLMQPYYPAPLCFNAHLQTMLGVLRQLTLKAPYYREIRAMPDGGCVALDWFRDSHVPQKTSAYAPILLVLHGITGGSKEGYVKWVCDTAEQRCWRAVVMTYRGCGDLSLTSPQAYNAVHTDDVHEVVQCIRRKFPGAPVFAVGYSLGALLLTKYTAEADAGRYATRPTQPGPPHPSASLPTPTAPTTTAHTSTPRDPSVNGETSPGIASISAPEQAVAGTNGHAGNAVTQLDGHDEGQLSGSGLSGAAIVSNPVCMNRAGDKLAVPWTMSWLYNLVITYRLKRYMRQHRHQFEFLPHICMDTISECWTLKQFDAAATIQSTGHASTEAYYSHGSSQNFIEQIRTPALILLSEDDPFLGYVPVEECRRNEHTILATTTHGGHCAHLQGLWPFGRSWADAAVIEFFEALRPVEGLSNPHNSIQDGLGTV